MKYCPSAKYMYKIRHGGLKDGNKWHFRHSRALNRSMFICSIHRNKGGGGDGIKHDLTKKVLCLNNVMGGLEDGKNEPRHEKTNVLVSDLVRHKPGCTATDG